MAGRWRCVSSSASARAAGRAAGTTSSRRTPSAMWASRTTAARSTCTCSRRGWPKGAGTGLRPRLGGLRAGRIERMHCYRWLIDEARTSFARTQDRSRAGWRADEARHSGPQGAEGPCGRRRRQLSGPWCYDAGRSVVCAWPVGDESALVRIELGEAVVEEAQSYEFGDAVVKNIPGGWHSASLTETSEVIVLTSDISVSQDEVYISGFQDPVRRAAEDRADAGRVAGGIPRSGDGEG